MGGCLLCLKLSTNQLCSENRGKYLGRRCNFEFGRCLEIFCDYHGVEACTEPRSEIPASLVLIVCST